MDSGILTGKFEGKLPSSKEPNDFLAADWLSLRGGASPNPSPTSPQAGELDFPRGQPSRLRTRVFFYLIVLYLLILFTLARIEAQLLIHSLVELRADLIVYFVEDSSRDSTLDGPITILP